MISCTDCKKAPLPLSKGGCIRTGGIVDIGCKYGEPCTRTNGDILRSTNDEELADLVFFELAQFPDKASLLGWLQKEVGT